MGSYLQCLFNIYSSVHLCIGKLYKEFLSVFLSFHKGPDLGIFGESLTLFICWIMHIHYAIIFEKNMYVQRRRKKDDTDIDTEKY